jgi:ubiquinone biosynthesis protein COQ9
MNGNFRNPSRFLLFMSSATRNTLLRLALPLVPSHGFTRQTLALSVLSLPSGSHQDPLNETAVSALFGEGDEARRTLINAWLDDARGAMSSYSTDPATGKRKSLYQVLDTRLKANEPILQYIPEVCSVHAYRC